jgi:hypothetical protein
MLAGVSKATLTRDATSLAHQTERRAHAAARQSRDWLVPLGRAGFAAKGLVYLLVGTLAAEAALGVGGDTTDSEGVLVRIVQAPYGSLALGAVAVGLAGYAAWRLLQAALDTEHKGTTLSGWATRLGYGVAGAAYLGLALTAAGLVLGTRDTADGDQAAHDRTAWLLQQPFGRALLLAVALVVIGVGLAQLVIAWRASFVRELRGLGAADARWVTWAGRLGYAARGVVFGLVGVFLGQAALEAQPEEARGLAGVLAALADEPLGPWLLGLVAVGLAAYGAFLLVEARYRRMVLD